MRLGEEVEELALGDRALMGDVVRLADRAGVVGGQDGGVGDVAGVDGAEGVVAPADQGDLARPEPADEPRGASSGRARRRASSGGSRVRRRPSPLGQAPEDALALDLAPGVVVPDRPEVLAERGRLVDRRAALGRVPVGARRADVEEPLDAGRRPPRRPRFRVASRQPVWNSLQRPQSPTLAAEW